MIVSMMAKVGFCRHKVADVCHGMFICHSPPRSQVEHSQQADDVKLGKKKVGHNEALVARTLASRQKDDNQEGA